MKFPQNLFKSFGVYIYLMFSLWWNLTRVICYTNTHWVPKSFFHFAQEKEAHLEFSILDGSLFESAFFSLIALPGHLAVTNGGTGDTSGTPEWKRYLWFCLTPWLITYAQGWLLNLCDFAWNMPSALEATNFRSFSLLWACQLVVQALLWSEVFCIALQGWMLMRSANKEQYNDTVRRMLFSSGVLYGFPNSEGDNVSNPSPMPTE